jgi:isopentenyl diphosphate isomerase/L-lactate dehydrogenase-like FMN-dependent dehydrogenase
MDLGLCDMDETWSGGIGMNHIEAMKQALDALEAHADFGIKSDKAITSLRQAIAEAEKQEPEAPMPSNTRYTVEVEGQARTYWDNIHDAITNAQRAVYASVDAITRAIDDLKAGRIAEWSYGFSAVRIYPPHNYTTPQPQPKREWVGLTDEDDIDWDGTGNLKQLVEAVEAKLKEKNT